MQKSLVHACLRIWYQNQPESSQNRHLNSLSCKYLNWVEELKSPIIMSQMEVNNWNLWEIGDDSGRPVTVLDLLAPRICRSSVDDTVKWWKNIKRSRLEKQRRSIDRYQVSEQKNHF